MPFQSRKRNCLLARLLCKEVSTISEKQQNIVRKKKIMLVSRAGIFNLFCFADLQKYPTRDVSSFVANPHHLARHFLASVTLP